MAGPWELYGSQPSEPTAPAQGPWSLYQGETAAPNVATDIAKQIGAGLVTGTEAIPAAVPSLMGAAGRLVEKYVPGMAPSPEEAANRQKLGELIEANRKGGISQYLPQPQTTAGEFARSAAEAVPALVGATKLNPLRAAGVGATSGLASEAAGQATKGTELEQPARIGAAVVAGGGALRQAEKAAAAAASPSIGKLKSAASAGYKAAADTGVEIAPKSAENLAAGLKAQLTEAGLDENVAPKTWGILSKLEGAPEEAVMTVQNFQSLRKTLGNAAGSIDRSERLAAVQAKNAVDDFLANLPEGAALKGDAKQASSLLKEANANYAAAERAAELDRRVVRAELRAAASNSGMNVANTIRQRMADILINPKLQRGYSAPELAQMDKIVRGGPIQNTTRAVGNVLGGGGGLGHLAAQGLFAGGAYASGQPELAAVPWLGLGLRSLSNAAALRQMRQFNSAVRANSPLGAASNFQFSAPAAPFAGLLPYLSK